MRLFGRVDGAGSLMMALSAVFVTTMTATFAGLQPAAARSATETMDIGDEPGRISSEEATITDGPFARQVVFFRSTEAPGTLVVHTSERFIYVVMGNSRRASLRPWRWARGLSMVRLSEDIAQGGMAGLDATAGDDCAAALPSSVHGRRPWESDGCPRPLSRLHHLPHTRHEPA